MYFLTCTNVADDVINFEVCRVMENTKTKISWEQNIIFSHGKKNH